MKSYEIQVNLRHPNGKLISNWTPSMTTTGRNWKKDLEAHRAEYPNTAARAVKIRHVKTLQILSS